MLQKTIILSLTVSFMFAVSGCKVIDEYAKSSRKYNSNRNYRKKAYRKPFVDRQTSKMVLDHCRSSRR